MSAGLLLVPEDRKTQGLILQAGLAQNISLPALPLLGRHPWFLDHHAELELAGRQCRALGIRARSLDQQVMLLSGGNQQKTVLAKWLALNPAVLLLDEPTRGVDVGAKSEIYSLLSDLAFNGLGILMVSSEMEEIIALSDRVLVMREGRIRAELTGNEIREETIMRLALGGKV